VKHRALLLPAMAAGALVFVGAASPSREDGGVWVLDDFQDGDRIAASGLGWTAVADDLTGGPSWTRLSVATAGPRSADRALRVAGHIAKGGFAGAWVALDGKARSTDIRSFAGLRLRVRGSGLLAAGFRGGPMPGTNYMSRFPANPGWVTVEVPFSELKPATKGPDFDPGDVRFVGIQVVRDQEGPFEFWIDDVSLYGATGSHPAGPVAAAGPSFVERLPPPLADARPRARWEELARDPVGDGTRPGLPDAVALGVLRDDAHGLVWFRVQLAAAPAEGWAGLNLALDVDGDPSNGTAWWGKNTSFRFDRLVTAWITDNGAGYQGQLGIADASEVAGGIFANPRYGVPGYAVDRANHAFVVTVPRTALQGGPGPVRLVAAVGSSFMHNDDIPNEGAIAVAR
jgi:hypothetical protein